jgi:glucan 1,4-alpha-glucosidase
MNQTPGIFKLRHYVQSAPDKQKHMMLAKNLALFVTIYSPLQMAADLTGSDKYFQNSFGCFPIYKRCALGFR